MRRPRRQLVTALGRTKAYLSQTNELGPLLQFAVATGLIKCENWSSFHETILCGERELIPPGRIHHKRAQVPFYIVHLFASGIHLRSSCETVTTTDPQESTLSPMTTSLSTTKTATRMLSTVLESTTCEVSRLVPYMRGVNAV